MEGLRPPVPALGGKSGASDTILCSQEHQSDFGWDSITALISFEGPLRSTDPVVQEMPLQIGQKTVFTMVSCVVFVGKKMSGLWEVTFLSGITFLSLLFIDIFSGVCSAHASQISERLEEKRCWGIER